MTNKWPAIQIALSAVVLVCAVILMAGDSRLVGALMAISSVASIAVAARTVVVNRRTEQLRAALEAAEV
jgi:hypothetical protein